MLIRIGLALLILLLRSWMDAPLAAQESSPEFRIPFTVNARSAALAEAYGAERRDATGMFWNPASLSFIEHTSAIASNEWTEEFRSNTFTGSFHLTDRHSLGVAAMAGFVRSNRRNVEGGEGPFHYAADLAYAYRFTPAFSVGVLTGVEYGQMEKHTIIASSTSIGLFYAPTPELSYCASYSGIGEHIVYADTRTALLQYRRPGTGNFQVGVSMRYPAAAQERILTVALANEKVFTERGLYYKGGLEVYPIRFVALRVGYFVEPVASLSRPTYGLGIRTDMIEIDYAYIPKKVTGILQQISLAVHW